MLEPEHLHVLLGSIILMKRKNLGISREELADSTRLNLQVIESIENVTKKEIPIGYYTNLLEILEISTNDLAFELQVMSRKQKLRIYSRSDETHKRIDDYFKDSHRSSYPPKVQGTIQELQEELEFYNRILSYRDRIKDS